MLDLNIPSSTKKTGAREHELIEQLVKYYHDQNFYVFPHSSLNISWGTVYVDLDLILVKNSLVSYVEVKSKNDHFSKAYDQIENVRDFIDFAYIAAEKDLSHEALGSVGLVSIKDNQISLVHPPQRIINVPSFHSILSIKKKCLEQFFYDLGNTRLISKYKLAYRIFFESKVCNKQCLQEIALCNRDCGDGCPLNDRNKICFYL